MTLNIRLCTLIDVINKGKPRISIKDLHIFDTAMSLGWQISLPVVIGGILGVMVDKFFQTKPIFIFIFIGLGMILSIYSVLQAVKKIS